MISAITCLELSGDPSWMQNDLIVTVGLREALTTESGRNWADRSGNDHADLNGSFLT